MMTTTSITVRVPLNIRWRRGRKTVVIPVAQDGAIPTRTDPALVKALARAFRYQRLLDEGRYASISEMATAQKIDRGYLGSILQLALLAPDLVEQILDGGRHSQLPDDGAHDATGAGLASAEAKAWHPHRRKVVGGEGGWHLDEGNPAFRRLGARRATGMRQEIAT
jgi:hypothetical protein